MKRKLLLSLLSLVACVLFVNAQELPNVDMEVTSKYISNADFSDGIKGWTAVTFGAPLSQNGFFASEAYAGWGSLEKTEFSLKQDVTLPKGKYRFVSHSFFRQGEGAKTNPEKSLGYVVVGDQKVAMKTLGCYDFAQYANSQAEGAGVFAQGMYENEIVFEVTEETQTLTVGLEGTFDEMKSWCIAGAFNLYVVGKAVADMTSHIVNNGFENDLNGWTVEGEWQMQNNGEAVKFGCKYVEKWQASGGLPDGKVYQKLTDLPAGYYKITASTIAKGTGTYFYANDERVEAKENANILSIETLITDGNLEVGYVRDNTTANWVGFDNVRLYFQGSVKDKVQATVDAAEPVAALYCEKAIKDAFDTALADLKAAIEADNAEAMLAANEVLIPLINQVKESAAAYAKVKAALDKANAIVAKYDEAGKTVYDAVVSEIQAAYNDGTIVTADCSDKVVAINNALEAAAKATVQPKSGADMTPLVVNASFESGDFSGWVNNSLQIQGNESFGKDGNKYAESWQPNGERSVKQTISGLPAGVYAVTVKAKARGLESASVFANEESEAMTIADEENDYTVRTSIEAGNDLVFGIEAVGTGAGSSWIACDNFRLTYVSPLDLTLDLETGADIASALEGKNFNNLTINLAENGTYTTSKTIEVPANLVINGNGATIDASALAAPFVTLNGTATWAKQIDAVDEEGNITSSSVSTSFKYIENVKIDNVIIKALGKALVRDNQKTLVENLLVNNSNIEIVGNSSIIDFASKGYPANLKVSNSTLWSKEGHGGFFAQLQNRLADIDKTKGKAYSETIAVENSTFYNISVDKKMNNLNQKGQTWLTFVLKNSIFYNVSTADELNGWNGGQDSPNPTMVYENNTYWSTDGAVAVWTDESKKTSDKTGTALTTDPTFVDAANGNFTIGASTDQAKFQTGDPRWLVEYDPTTAIENAVVETVVNGVIYNLAGQKVDASYKGIVIKNGKKALVK